MVNHATNNETENIMVALYLIWAGTVMDKMVQITDTICLARAVNIIKIQRQFKNHTFGYKRRQDT